MKISEQYVTDQDGKRKAVLLSLKEYRRILKDLEELEAIRAYDAAKASGDDEVPFDVATTEIERNH